MVGNHHDVGFVAQSECAEFIEQQADLAVVIADGCERIGMAGAEAVLDMIGFGHPDEGDVWTQCGQHVLAQHLHRPIDGAVIAICCTAFFGRRSEFFENCFAYALGIRNLAAREKIAVDYGAGASVGFGREQDRAAGRARTHGHDAAAVLRQQLGDTRRGRHVAASHLIEFQQRLEIVVGECAQRIDRRHEDRIAHDAVARRIGAGGERGGIDTCYRRENRMGVLEIDTLAPQTFEIWGFSGADAVGAQTVDDQNQLEVAAGLRIGGACGCCNEKKRERESENAVAHKSGSCVRAK